MTVAGRQHARAVATAPSPRVCASCRFFRSDPRLIEAAIPGLVTMSSGYAAVRANDGLCERHDRYLAGSSSCGDYAARLHGRGQVESF